MGCRHGSTARRSPPPPDFCARKPRAGGGSSRTDGRGARYEVAAGSGSRSGLTSAGSPRSGNGHLDRVEVARDDGVGEHRARLVAQLAAGVARREVREREHAHARAAARPPPPGARSSGRSRARARARSSPNVASWTSRSAPCADHGRSRRARVSPGEHDLAPAPRSRPITCSGATPSDRLAPLEARRSRGPARRPAARACSASKRPGPVVLDERVAVAP